MNPRKTITSLMSGAASAVSGTDPVQQIMHDLIVQPVAHDAADTRGADPSLLAEHAKRLGHSVFRPTERCREIADTDPRRAVQSEQDLQTVGVRQQIEALGPTGRVDVGQRRRRAFDLCLVPGPAHGPNLTR
jgi:hypothetical protein